MNFIRNLTGFKKIQLNIVICRCNFLKIDYRTLSYFVYSYLYMNYIRYSEDYSPVQIYQSFGGGGGGQGLPSLGYNIDASSFSETSASLHQATRR
jgi:hypothetical protein